MLLFICCSGRFTSTAGLVDVCVGVLLGLSSSTEFDGRFALESGAELSVSVSVVDGSSKSLLKPHKEQFRLRYWLSREHDGHAHVLFSSDFDSRRFDNEDDEDDADDP